MPYIGNPIYQSAFVTDQFSGNGSTTAFTMSVAPAGTSNVLVVVSGVVQDPSTYGVVGTTLNFTTAPPSGTGNISCRYLGVPVTGVTSTAYRTLTEFTATAGQTTFSPPSYTVGYINVLRNGVQLGTADFTASNGTTVVLATGATAGDLITTESFYVSSVLNAIPTTGGTISGNLFINGVETVGSGTPISGATNPIVVSTGNSNNYVQSYIVNNNSAGANASADFTAYPSNGADSAGWVDMGITGPNFSQAAYSVTGPNEAYLFGSAPSGASKTGNLVIATDSTGTANSIQFYTGGFTKAKSAAAMQIDSSGNVGVGTTTSPSTYSARIASYSTTASGANISLIKGDSGTAQQNGQLINFYNYGPAATGRNAGTTIGGFYFGCSQPTSGAIQDAGAISCVAESQSGNNTASALTFSTNTGNSGNAERMRVDSTGNLCIGTTTAGANLTVASGKNSGFLQQLYTTTNGADYIQFYNGSQVGSITRSGGTNVNYNTSSDYRLKHDIQPIQNALQRVAQLKPVTYKWNIDNSEGEGFIAHELQEVCPQAVHGEKDAVNEDGSINPQGIDTSHIVGLLTAAIQEQQEIIKQLQADVAALKAGK